MKPEKISMLVLLCICLSSCRSNPEPVFPKFDSEAVAKGATQTWKNYVASFQGKPVKFYGEIAPVLWAPAIRNLKPAYVYAHGVNIAIVRSCRNGKEEGIYVALAIASSSGPMDQQFTKMLIAHSGLGSVCTFVRDGCLTRTSIPAPIQSKG
jgi:hypothetical protein